MGKLIAVNREEVEKYLSPYGNQEYTINDELIAELKNGKVLLDDDWDEYGVVIEMVGDV
jgi:hypothetical protein